MEDPWDQVRFGQHCGNWFVQILRGFLVCFSVRFHSCSDDMFSCSVFLVVQFLFYFLYCAFCIQITVFWTYYFLS